VENVGWRFIPAGNPSEKHPTNHNQGENVGWPVLAYINRSENQTARRSSRQLRGNSEAIERETLREYIYTHTHQL
jgi:hypothetical protein